MLEPWYKRKPVLKKIAISYTVVIILLSVLPVNGGDSLLNDRFILSIRLDYLVHFALFIPWMLLIWIFTGVRFNNTPLKASGWIVAGLILAVSSEYLQYFLPYRAFNINDLVANCLGVLLGSVFFFFKKPGFMNQEPRIPCP
jgi:glycopeptide antibiotics resistance protein